MVSANFEFGVDRSAEKDTISGQQFSASLAKVLGVNPVMGRWFTETEASPVVVLGYRLWRSRFGGARDILTKRVRIDGQVTSIIGVMPDGFLFLDPKTEFWVPLPVDRYRPDPSRYLWLTGRLKAGISLPQAQEDLTAVAANLARTFPATNKDWGMRAEPIREIYVGWLQKPLLILQGVAALVLMIACANVAALVLAQSMARSKEVSVRAALGATRWRILRQCLTESVFLSFIGGALGIGLAFIGLRLFALFASEWFPRPHPIGLDMRVLAVTVLLSSITGLICGALPALRFCRPDVIEPLSTRGATAGSPSVGVRHRLRSALVVFEIAIALVLLIGAGLLINAFLRLYSMDPGCDPRNAAFFRLRVPRERYVKNAGFRDGRPVVETSPLMNAVFEQVRERLAVVPGVQSVAAGEIPPLSSGSSYEYRFTIAGRAHPEKDGLTAEGFPVSAGYFQALRIPILRGRDFEPRDSASGPGVAIINETMARRFWGGKNPIGSLVQIDAMNERPREIVGVAGGVRHDRFEREIPPQMYIPYVQQPLTSHAAEGPTILGDPRVTMTFIIRTVAEPLRLVPRLRSAVAEVDHTLPVFSVKTLNDYVSEGMWQPAMNMTFLSIFSGIAAVLALIGIYGVMAHSVRQRTQEIGIRMALGSSTCKVLWLVISRGLLLILLGTAFGLGAAIALTRLMQSVLWGVVATTDSLTFGAVILVLVAVSLLACYLAARRALSIEPTVALRHE